MGDKGSKEAAPEEVKAFFKQDTFKYSGCVDLNKLQIDLGSPAQYVFYQASLEKEYETKDIKNVKNEKQFKEIFRSGLPDKLRRDAILQLYNLNSISCEGRFQTILKMQSEDFLEMTKKNQLYSKNLQYSFLSEKGLHNLDILMSILFTERHIKHSPVLIQVGALLLLFLKPAEAYHVLIELVNSSKAVWQNQEQQALIRWHFTFEKNQYFKLLTTFVKSYLNTTLRKKRSVLKHMKKINFEFSEFVDASFRTMCTEFVPLPVAIDVLMMFLLEGTKIIFRYTYAILKCSKAFLKAHTDPANFLVELAKHSKTEVDPKKLHKAALAYPLKRSNYDFKKAKAEGIDPNAGGSDFADYMPNVPLNSTIINFEELASIWRMMPDYVKIRVPELFFACQTDGYNINNLYRKCAPIQNDYKFSLLLMQTKKNQVFGFFIDEVFGKGKDYIGSSESFVFTVRPEVKVYYDTGANARYLLGENEYFQIGGEGDGPALWVNETLDRGQTNPCPTFGNPMLTFGEKGKDETYEIHNLELFIL